MLFKSENPCIRIGKMQDSEKIVTLLNSAYRGESSKKGWTTEAGLIEGDQRTDSANLHAVMQQEGSIFLVYINSDNSLLGCVNLQQQGERIYLGMFSVQPELQGGGIDKQLLKAAEEYALAVGCTTIFMSVISVRSELIAWYKRHGYIDTGERKPFEEDLVTGHHLQPLEFSILEKKL